MALAFVLINTEVGAEKIVIEKLKNISSVKDVYYMDGTYDILVKISETDSITLRKALIDDIRKIKEIESTITLIAREGDISTKSGKIFQINNTIKARKRHKIAPFT